MRYNITIEHTTTHVVDLDADTEEEAVELAKASCCELNEVTDDYSIPDGGIQIMDDDGGEA